MNDLTPTRAEAWLCVAATAVAGGALAAAFLAGDEEAKLGALVVMWAAWLAAYVVLSRAAPRATGAPLRDVLLRGRRAGPDVVAAWRLAAFALVRPRWWRAVGRALRGRT